MKELTLLAFALLSPLLMADPNWRNRPDVSASATRLSAEAKNLLSAIKQMNGRRLFQLKLTVEQLSQEADLFEAQVADSRYGQSYCHDNFDNLRQKYLALRELFHQNLDVPHEDCDDEWYYSALDAFTRFALEYRKLRDFFADDPVTERRRNDGRSNGRGGRGGGYDDSANRTGPFDGPGGRDRHDRWDGRSGQGGQQSGPVIVLQAQFSATAVGLGRAFQGTSFNLADADRLALAACVQNGFINCRVVNRSTVGYGRTQSFLSQAQGEHAFTVTSSDLRQAQISALQQCQNAGFINCRLQ